VRWPGEQDALSRRNHRREVPLREKIKSLRGSEQGKSPVLRDPTLRKGQGSVRSEQKRGLKLEMRCHYPQGGLARKGHQDERLQLQDS